MDLIQLEEKFCVCKLREAPQFKALHEPFFIAVTKEEISLVCREEDCPKDAIAAEKDWRALRVAGTLDFKLIGVIAEISAVLAKQGISLFVVSTFDTDYVLVKDESFKAALIALNVL